MKGLDKIDKNSLYELNTRKQVLLLKKTKNSVIRNVISRPTLFSKYNIYSCDKLCVKVARIRQLGKCN